MIELTPHEARVLGVLIEKAHTTPGQYPMTLNGLTVGCNQKSNREPVLELSEEEVLDAVEGLRRKQLAATVDMAGSRVFKYRHQAREALDVQTPELVILAELMLRGPQTVGELRTRASRMHTLESLDVVRNTLDSLAARTPPLVDRLPPAPGSRAERFAQRLSPKAHPEPASPAATAPATTPAASSQPAPAGAPSAPPVPADPDLAARVEELEGRIAELEGVVQGLVERLPDRTEGD